MTSEPASGETASVPKSETAASISIAMATYNGARFLPEQLESFASQSLLPIEVQVGDDGSSDGSIEILNDFARCAPFPVHVHLNPGRLGYGENFLQTARRCTGQWIAFCDQDDIWLPEKLSACAAIIAQGPPDLSLVAHNSTIVDEDLRPLGKNYFVPLHLPREGLYEPMELSPEWLTVGMSQVFRGDLVRDIDISPRLGFPWREEKDAHDLWIALLGNALGSVFYDDRQLVLYRRHATTAMRDDIGAPVWARIRRRLTTPNRDPLSRSHYLNHAAELLEGRADTTPRPDLRARLYQAGAKIRLQARFLQARAEVQQGDTLGKRIAALKGLSNMGGYRGGEGWPFGLTRLVLDLAFSMIPRSGRGSFG